MHPQMPGKENTLRNQEIVSRLAEIVNELESIKQHINDLSRRKLSSSHADPGHIDITRQHLKTLHEAKNKLEKEHLALEEEKGDIDYHTYKKLLNQLHTRKNEIIQHEIPKLKREIDDLDREKKRLNADILRLSNIITRKKYR